MALNNIDQIVNDIIDIRKQKRNETLYKYNHSEKGKIRSNKFNKSEKARKLFFNYDHSEKGIIRKYKYRYDLKDFDKNEIKQIIILKNNLFGKKCNVNYLLHIYDLFNIDI